MKNVIYLMLIHGCFLVGCGKEQLPLYHGDRAVLFNTADWSGSERVYSFAEDAGLNTEKYRCRIPVYLVGRSSHATDTFRYTVVVTGDDLRCIGYQEETVWLERAVAPGISIDTLELHLLRLPELRDTSLTIYLDLPGEDKDKIRSRGMWLRIDDQFRKPVYWDVNQGFFGTFSSAKMRVMVEAFERYESTAVINWWMDGSALDWTMEDWGMYLSERLEEARNAGSPLLEKDGSEMEAGILVKDNKKR